MIDALPPNDDDAERGLIANALIDAAALEEVPYITPEHFRIVRYGAIWAAMWRLYDRHKTFDFVSLSNELNSNESSITELMGITTVDDGSLPQPTTVLATRIREAATRRALKAAGALIAEAAMRDKHSIDDTLNKSMAAVEAVLEGHVSITDDTQRARDIAVDVLTEAWGWHNNPADVRGLACGLEPVDDMLGGFETGWLYSIAGRPGQGKSALLA